MTSLKKFIYFSRSLHRSKNRGEPAGNEDEEEYWKTLEEVPMVPLLYE